MAGGADADGSGGLVGSNFDLRQTGFKKLLGLGEKTFGLKLGADSKLWVKDPGGHRGDMERAEKRDQARADSIKVAKYEALQQKLNEEKEKLQLQKSANSHNLTQIETRRDVSAKNTEIQEKEKRAAKGRFDITKSVLDAFGADKALEELNKATSAHKNAQDEAEVADAIAKKAEDRALTGGDAEKNAAATARVDADRKEEIIKKKEKEKTDAEKKYNAITSPVDPVTGKETDYSVAKNEYDAAKYYYEEAEKEFQKRSAHTTGLVRHRKNIKDAEAGNSSVADTEATLKKAEVRFEAAKKVVERAEARLDAAVNDDDKKIAKRLLKIAEAATEKRKRVQEVAYAIYASAKYNDGRSLNKSEDEILPNIEKEIEDTNRERLTAKAELIRGESASKVRKTKAALDTLIAQGTPATDPAYARAVIAKENAILMDKISNTFRTFFSQPGDNKASRNEAAHKIMMEAQNKKI
jgi:hypothetical protein